MDNRLFRTTAIWLAALVCLVAVFFFFIDRSLSLSMRSLKGGGFYQAATALSWLANHELINAALFCCLVFIGVKALTTGLTPGLRLLAYCCLAVLVTMALGETLKWALGRYRPQEFFKHELYGFSFFADKGSRHSFPSGHTFRIFSAMTALSMVWPKARVWLISLAVLVGLSRVIVTRHFPSDIMAGAFLGIFTALWVWSIMRPDKAGNENPVQTTGR